MVYQYFFLEQCSKNILVDNILVDNILIDNILIDNIFVDNTLVNNGREIKQYAKQLAMQMSRVLSIEQNQKLWLKPY